MSDVIVSTTESTTNVTTSNDVTTVAITDTVVEVSQATAGLQGVPGSNSDPTYVYVTNKTGSQLAKGSIVYVSGANGTHTQVTLAIATGDTTSARTLGWLSEDIANNATGLCMVEGYLDGVNTQGIVEGSQLYLSPTVAGGFTATKPQAPNHLVYVGVAVKASAGNGRVFVKVQNGYEISELHDVRIVNATNLDVLQYFSSTGLWQNVQPSTLSVGTATNASTATYAVNAGTSVGLSGSITRSQVSDFTSGTVSQATNASTATYAVNAGTAVYASVAGSVVNSGTANYALLAGTASYATAAGTATYATTSGTSTYATTAGTSVSISGSITRSQVSDFTSGTVAEATNASTATYATTSGTAVSISGSITKSQVSDFTSGTVAQATNASTATYATTAGTSVSISGSITRSQVSDYASGTVANISGTVAQSQVTNLTTDLANRAKLDTANAFTVGGHTITNAATAVVPLIVKAVSGQSANLQQWTDSVSTPLGGINNVGGFYTTNRIAVGFSAVVTGTKLISQPGVATDTAATLRGASSQLADLLQLQNSAGTITGGRNTNSQIFTGSTAAIQTTVPSVSTLTGDGTTVTVTTISAHNLAVGDRITISGVTPSGYNGTVIVASTPTVNTFTYANATTGAYSGGGTIGVDSQLSVTARSAITTPVVVKGAASQSANLTTWTDSTNTIKARISGGGSLLFPQTGTSINADTGNAVINANSASAVHLVVKAAASQSANLQEWQTSSGSTAASIDSTGMGNFLRGNFRGAVYGSGIYYGSVNILQEATSGNGITLQGRDSATVDLIRIRLGATPGIDNDAIRVQNSSGNTISRINSSGQISTGGSAVLGQVTVLPASTATVGVVVQGLSGQSANLQEWQTSTGSTAARVDSGGIVYGSQVRTTSSLGLLTESVGGGLVTMARATATPSAPGANAGRLYFRDGTITGLKLVVRAGVSGAETTILDNIPTT